jgi:hypothetical protein
MEPSTVYGISKQAGEDGANTTIIFFGVDVQVFVIRLISYSSPQVAERQIMPLIFFKALSDKKYECFYPRKLTHDVYG